MSELIAIISKDCPFCAFLKHFVNFSKKNIPELNKMRLYYFEDALITKLPESNINGIAIPLVFIRKNNNYTFLNTMSFLEEIIKRTKPIKDSGFLDYINNLPEFEQKMCYLHPLLRHINDE